MREQPQCGVLIPGTAASGSQRLHVLSAIAVAVLKVGSASKPCLPAGLIGRILASAKYTWECIPVTQSIQRLLLPGIKGCLVLPTRQPTHSSQDLWEGDGLKSSFPALFLTLKCHSLLTLWKYLWNFYSIHILWYGQGSATASGQYFMWKEF